MVASRPTPRSPIAMSVPCSSQCRGHPSEASRVGREQSGGDTMAIVTNGRTSIWFVSTISLVLEVFSVSGVRATHDTKQKHCVAISIQMSTVRSFPVGSESWMTHVQQRWERKDRNDDGFVSQHHEQNVNTQGNEHTHGQHTSSYLLVAIAHTMRNKHKDK